MPRFYFHLFAPDQCIQDNVGCDVTDLSAAHFRAVQLADRVMTFGGLADCEPDLRRWTVEVTDACQRSILTVIFPANFEQPRAFAQINGARALLQHLAIVWDEAGRPYSTSAAIAARE